MTRLVAALSRNSRKLLTLLLVSSAACLLLLHSNADIEKQLQLGHQADMRAMFDDVKNLQYNRQYLEKAIVGTYYRKKALKGPFHENCTLNSEHHHQISLHVCLGEGHADGGQEVEYRALVLVELVFGQREDLEEVVADVGRGDGEAGAAAVAAVQGAQAEVVEGLALLLLHVVQLVLVRQHLTHDIA